MKPIHFALFTLFACVTIALFARTAEATIPVASGGTCSSVATNTGGVGAAYRTWIVIDASAATGVPGDEDCVNSYNNAGDPCFFGTCNITDVPSGNSINLKCVEQASGTTMPLDSTSVTIRGLADNTAYGVNTGTPIWTQTFTTCPISSAGNAFTEFCTVDGTSGGAVRYGIVRIQIHVVNNPGVTVYDIHSETNTAATGEEEAQNVGIYRCDPRPTVLDTGATPPSVWIGGNTIGSRLQVDSASYVTQNTAQFHINCQDRETSDITFQAGTTTTTNSVTIQGSPDTWKSGCTIKANASLFRLSSISLYSTTPYSIWDQASPLTGVTFPSSTLAVFTGTTLNRILTLQGTCTFTVQGVAESIVMRLQTATDTGACLWHNPDTTNIIAGTNARSWWLLAGEYRVSSNFPSADLTFTGSGANAGQVLSAQTATFNAVTTTGGAYKRMVEEFGDATRTDSVLWNWGNSTGVLDVSSTATLVCHLLDPVNHLTSDITLYNPGEATLCRSTTFTGANTLGIQSTLIRTAYRRSTQPSLDSTDINTCDSTTNATGSGGWTCDSTIKNTAAKTTAQAYLVEVCAFADAGRTQQAYCATTSGKFDVVATYTATCPLQDPISGAAGVVAVQRGNLAECRVGSITNARGQADPSGALLRVTYHRASTADTDQTDFNQCDVTTSVAGQYQCDSTAKTTATATTGLLYGVTVRKFSDAGRTLMLTEANVSNLFDVSANFSFNNITIAKQSNGINQSCLPCSFTISANTEFVHTETLRDINHNPVAVANVTCQRTDPASQLETAVSMGTTNSQGISPEKQFLVLTPQGLWHMTCTIATMNGNSATYTIQFFHASAFTADTRIQATYTLRVNGTCGMWLNVTAAVEQVSNGDVVYGFPDTPLVLEIQKWGFNNTGAFTQEDMLEPVQMTLADGSALYTYETCLSSLPFYNTNQTLEPIHFHVTGNVTGRPFLSGYQIMSVASATNGNFTGSFIGTVIDTSAIPQTLLVTGFFMLLIAASYALSWLGKGQAMYAIMLGLAGELFTGMMLLDNQALVESGTFVGLLIIIAATIILLVSRLFQVGWAKPMGEEAGVE